jgi:hypothetical protein
MWEMGFGSGLEARGGHIGEKTAAHIGVKAPNRPGRQAENARISGQKRIKMLEPCKRKCPRVVTTQGH